MKTEKIIKEWSKLPEWERHGIVLDLLYQDKISFTEISQLYVQSLRQKDVEKSININGLALTLSAYWDGEIDNKMYRFTKAKAAYHMLKSKIFRTAPYEKILEKFLKKVPYSESKDGIAKYKN